MTATIPITLTDHDLFRCEAFIAGDWTEADNGARFAVRNPADGLVIAEVADLGVTETRRAIEAAHSALPGWRALPPGKRATHLRRWYEAIIAAQDDLAALMTLEQGKPLAESKGEVLYGASFVEWFAAEAQRIYGDVMTGPGKNNRGMVFKQPVGVVAAITPWNFPNAMITRKVAPALAAGCTVVIKPSEDTPLSALALAELAHRVGIPAGVLNVVTTGNAIAVGRELTGNPIVRKVSFTGSTEVGKILMRQSADTVKKISLELGGNAPFIVFDDADVPAAVRGAMGSKYRNAGQTCICANRLYVHDAVYDEFAKGFTAAVRELQVGPGTQDGVSVGPLINDEAAEKVERLVRDALAKGASATVGGNRHALGGRFFEPTVLTNVTRSMAIADEEIFGPVAPLYRFETEEEVVRLANDTPYGLAAYFYARDIARIWRVSEALDYGMVGVNTTVISSPLTPFGGMKESGIGREGSKYGIEEFLETKYVALDLT